jgi:tetratricopeptide (TPR) repeat protein
MADLPAGTHQRIRILCAEGDSLADRSEYPAALERYWEAFDLLPEPKTDWEAATWILAAIGDANFQGRDYKAGRDNLSVAMRCPKAVGNPFLHLRLGQCQFELGNLDRAADELVRVIMAVGPDLFENEDPKYFEFLRKKLESLE